MRIDELKAQRIWVCFIIRKKDGGFEKKPISAYGTETGSDADHAHTWVTYDEAVRAMKEKGYDGIGFALPEGFFFVDIDHRDLTDPLLVMLLERFASYTEYSYSGNGVHIYGICDISRVPTAHAKANGINIPDNRDGENDYVWRDSTISHMLSRPEYLGHTVNFKTYRKSYKQKKQLKNDPANRQIFENMHEAIIDQETYDIVQRIRDGRRRVTPMGEMPALSGMVFCADCGAKMYQVRGRKLPQSEYMVCATYRKKGKDVCPSHQIRNSEIEKHLLSGIMEITGYVQAHEDEFVEMITKKSRAEVDRSLRDGKRELEQSQARLRKLDEIIQRLYEDNIEGKISDERFAKMSENYETEQKTLKCRVTELRGMIAAQQESSVNVNLFLAKVRKYTDVRELTPEIIREFVDRIEIFKPERISGHKVQRMRVVWNCIGEFMPPQPKDNEKSA